MNRKRVSEWEKRKWADNSLFGWLNLKKWKMKMVWGGFCGRASEALMKSNWMRKQKPEKKVPSDFFVRYHFID